MRKKAPGKTTPKKKVVKRNTNPKEIKSHLPPGNPWTSVVTKQGVEGAPEPAKKPRRRLAPAMRGRADYTSIFEFTSQFKPLVSIITTVYDRVGCLECCINSVQKQKFKNYEHIIVSDCPPEEIVMKIYSLVQEKDNGKISYYNLDKRYANYGIAPASAGLELARGKYVCFLSDDNVYLPDHLLNLVNVIEKSSKYGFVYSNCLYRGRRVLNPTRPRQSRIDLGQPLFKREIFKILNVNLTKYNMHAWDWEMISYLLAKGVKYRHISENTFVFRIKSYPHIKKRFC